MMHPEKLRKKPAIKTFLVVPSFRTSIQFCIRDAFYSFLSCFFSFCFSFSDKNLPRSGSFINKKIKKDVNALTNPKMP
jgi:hypothetical protein